MKDIDVNDVSLNDIITKRMNKDIKIVNIAFFIAFSGYFSSHFIMYAIIDYFDGHYILFIDDFTVVLFVFIPMVITFGTASAIFSKYHYVLLCLMSHISGKNYDLNYLLAKYKQWFKAFERDYNFYLKWSIYLWFLAIVFQVWTTLDDFFHERPWFRYIADGSYAIAHFGLILLFFYSSSALTETFKQFEALLYQISFNENDGEYWKYNHLLLFMSKYRLTVKLGKIEMTKQNIIVFITTLVITKLLTYLSAQFYQH